MARLTVPSRAPRSRALFVFAAAVLAQSWILALPFQFDDYALLADPLSLFERVIDPGGAAGSLRTGAAVEAPSADVEPFMMRWTLWLFWGLCAALSGEPLSPVPFHLLALLLHGLVCVLLARLVTRLAPADFSPAGRRRAGILAGLLFAVGAGGMAAVSWPAAQSDLLFPLFGLLAANAFVDARPPRAAGGPGAPGAVGAATGRARARRLALAFLWTWIALVSKAPAFLVPPVLGAVLWLARPPVGPRRPLAPRVVRVEWAVLAAALVSGFVSRYLYLGTFRLQYQHVGVPGPAELAGTFARGVQALGQALYPWNRDPVFGDDGPWLAERVFEPIGLSAPAVALVLCGALLAFACVRRRSLARPVVACVVLAAVCAIPSGLLYEGQPTNVVGRTTYFPLLLVVPALALAGIALAEEVGRLGVAACAVFALVTIDATVHVARTEVWAAEHQSAAFLAIQQAVTDHAVAGSANELAVVVVLPDDGIGGIPALGYRLADASRPPFRASPVDVRVFDTPDGALEHLLAAGLARRDLAVLGREWSAEPLETNARRTRGAAERERLRVGAWAPLRPGLPPSRGADDLWTVRPDAWDAREPVAAHALAVAAIELPPGDATRGDLLLERTSDDTVAIPLEIAASSTVRRVPFAPWLTLEAAIDAPIRSVRWSSDTPDAPIAHPPSPLATLPALLPDDPAPGARLPAAGSAPAFAVRAPDTLWTLPSATRLELRALLPRGPQVFFEGTPDELSWTDLATRVAEAAASKPRYDGQMEWRAARVHPAGHLAARSPHRPAQIFR